MIDELPPEEPLVLTLTAFERDSFLHKFLGQRVIGTHEIGDYQFIETAAGDEKRFFAYIKGRSIGHYEDSLDAALIVAIAYKYDGTNSQAAHYFAKMIGMGKG